MISELKMHEDMIPQWSSGYDANPNSERPGFEVQKFLRLLIITYYITVTF